MKSRNVTICMMVVVLCLACQQVIGLTRFNDGGHHIIDYEIDETVEVEYGTSVEIVAGGNISGYVEVWDNSQVTLSGGSIGEFLFAYDNAQVTVTGGNVYGGLQPFNYSQAVVSGGYIEGTFATSDESKGFVSGGSMVDLYAGDNSHITFSGGTSRTWLTADHNGTIRFSGGSIEYGILAGLYDETDTGLIIIEGTDFGVNGTAVEYGEYASDYAVPGMIWGYSCLTGTITGTLESGQYLSENFYIFGNSDITFVPEPATILLLGLGGLALRLRSGQALRRRCRA